MLTKKLKLGTNIDETGITQCHVMFEPQRDLNRACKPPQFITDNIKLWIFVGHQVREHSGKDVKNGYTKKQLYDPECDENAQILILKIQKMCLRID
jgi:hypothetical protein